MIKIWKVAKFTEKKDFSEIKTYGQLEGIVAMRLSKYIIVEDIYGKKHNIKTLSQLAKIKNILPADEIRKNMQLGNKMEKYDVLKNFDIDLSDIYAIYYYKQQRHLTDYNFFFFYTKDGQEDKFKCFKFSVDNRNSIRAITTSGKDSINDEYGFRYISYEEETPEQQKKIKMGFKQLKDLIEYYKKNYPNIVREDKDYENRTRIELHKNKKLSGYKYWSQDVTKKVKKSEKPKIGTFTKNAEYIVNELIGLSEGDIDIAIKKIQFFINRAGKNLKNKKEILRAKKILQDMNQATEMKAVAGINEIDYQYDNYSIYYDSANGLVFFGDNQATIEANLPYEVYKSYKYIVVDFNNKHAYGYCCYAFALRKYKSLKRKKENHVMMVNSQTDDIII